MKLFLGPGQLIIPFSIKSVSRTIFNNQKVPAGWWYKPSPHFKLVRPASYLELYMASGFTINCPQTVQECPINDSVTQSIPEVADDHTDDH